MEYILLSYSFERGWTLQVNGDAGTSRAVVGRLCSKRSMQGPLAGSWGQFVGSNLSRINPANFCASG